MMIRLIGLILIIMAASCNGTNTNSSETTADSLQVEVEDTLPFEAVADTLENIVTETEAVADTVVKADNTTSGKGNIKKGNDGNDNQVETVRNKLIGSWKWEKTKCCGRNAQWYTDTLQENRILKFKKDGVVEFYQNGKLQSLEQYKLQDEGVYPERPQITIGDKTHGPALLSIEDNKMIINYGYMDLQIEYYTKVK